MIYKLVAETGVSLNEIKRWDLDDVFNFMELNCMKTDYENALQGYYQKEADNAMRKFK